MKVKFVIPEEVFRRKRKAKYTINGDEITAKAGVFLDNGDGTYSWVFDYICYDSGKPLREGKDECAGVPEILDARLKPQTSVYWKYSRRYEDYVEKRVSTYKSNLKLKRLFLKTLELLKNNSDKVKIIIEPSNFESEFLRTFEVALFVGSLGIENLNIETPVSFKKFLPYIRNFRKAMDGFIDPEKPALFSIAELISGDSYKTTELYVVRMKKYHQYATNKYEGVIEGVMIGWDSKKEVLITFPQSTYKPESEVYPRVVYSLIHRRDEGPYPELYGKIKPAFKTVTPDAIHFYILEKRKVVIHEGTEYKAVFSREPWHALKRKKEEFELTIDTGVRLVPLEWKFRVIKGGKELGTVFIGNVEPEDRIVREGFLDLMERGIIELDRSRGILSEDIRFGYNVVPMKLNGKPVKGGVAFFSAHLQILAEVRAGDVITIESKDREFRFLVIAIGDRRGVALDVDGYSNSFYNEPYRPFWDIDGDYLIKS